MTRIAHIDRPTGARPSLYPTLSSLRPTLKFETHNYLLVAWGDCLMGLTITDHSSRPLATDSERQTPIESTTGSPEPQQSQIIRRRTVQCEMAWELDCVACGVCPIDSEHVMVLGLVPPSDEDDDEWKESGSLYNDLEVQIISRSDGSIVFANILPILSPLRDDPRVQAAITESAADYTLLSSFALPRMEDAYEATIEEETTPDDEFDIQVSLFSPNNQTTKRFVDPHLNWNLKNTAFEDEESARMPYTLGDNADSNSGLPASKKTANEEDAASVDSDDYGFINRTPPNNEDDTPPPKSTASPPLMVITSGSDSILAKMRSVDDAIAHALETGRSALALKRALRQKRRIRRFQISYLVNEYFTSLLRIPRSHKGIRDDVGTKPLSLRRLKFAAKAMPVLFGVNVELWERWTSEMGKIPGALFVLTDYIPVRDPKLPEDLYGRILETMLDEIYQMVQTNKNENDPRGSLADVLANAEQCFLDTLTGWGATDFLKEHIKLCKNAGVEAGNKAGMPDVVTNAEMKFSWRFNQTSARYLTFPVIDGDGNVGSQIRSEGYYDKKSALFDVDRFLKVVQSRTPLLFENANDVRSLKAQDENPQVALDAMAKLNMMKGRYDASLKCSLFIGALHSSRSVPEFEAAAVDFSDSVGTRDIDKPLQTESGVSFTYLLDVIDDHNLHECLLDGRFLSATGENEALPLFSLLQLVGLNEMGRFLLKHCVPPFFADKNSLRCHEGDYLAASEEERRGTLPLDLVAAQLERSPKLLHWYLHLVSTKKPEVYIRFPNTAYPPRAVTELHRLDFDLYIEYAGPERDSARFLSGLEAYKVSGASTRLLEFLKVSLNIFRISCFAAASTNYHALIVTLLLYWAF